MWKVIASSNLNPPLKLFFYLPILANNNMLFKIYCKNIVVAFLNCHFLFFILFFLSFVLTFLLLSFFFLLFFSLVFSPPYTYAHSCFHPPPFFLLLFLFLLDSRTSLSFSLSSSLFFYFFFFSFFYLIPKHSLALLDKKRRKRERERTSKRSCLLNRWSKDTGWRRISVHCAKPRLPLCRHSSSSPTQLGWVRWLVSFFFFSFLLLLLWLN